MAFRIDPKSYSAISGMNYADAVASVMESSGLSFEQAQSLIDIKQFTPPLQAPAIDDGWYDAAWSAFDALGGGETDERAAFRAGYLAGARLAAAQVTP